MSGGLITIDTNEVTAIAAIETKVAALSERYSMLEIAGPDDRKGFDRVHEARMDVRDLRITTEKRRKAAKEAVTQFGKALDGAANKIFALIEPLESSLQAKEDAYNAAKERIKAEAEAARKAKLQARVDALQAVRGAVPLAVLEALTDEQFAAELACWKKQDDERKEKEAADAKAEAERQAEAERLRKEQEAQLAAERAKLEAERKAQEELQRIEREKIEAERRKADEEAAAERAKQAEAKRLIDEERRKLEAEKARLEREEFERQAKAKAEQEAREKLAREQAEQARLEAERKEREAAEAARREAMKPDLQKLREYAAALEAVPIPSVTDEAVKNQVMLLAGSVEDLCAFAEKWCDEQEAKP